MPFQNSTNTCGRRDTCGTVSCLFQVSTNLKTIDKGTIENYNTYTYSSNSCAMLWNLACIHQNLHVRPQKTALVTEGLKKEGEPRNFRVNHTLRVRYALHPQKKSFHLGLDPKKYSGWTHNEANQQWVGHISTACFGKGTIKSQFQ